MSDKEQRIRARAYEIYEQDGRHDGRAEEHWQQAKREIEHALASAQAQAAEAPAQPPTTADEPTRPSPKQTQTGADALGAQGARRNGPQARRKRRQPPSQRGQSDVGPNALAPSAAGLRRTASKTRFRGRRP